MIIMRKVIAAVLIVLSVAPRAHAQDVTANTVRPSTPGGTVTVSGGMTVTGSLQNGSCRLLSGSGSPEGVVTGVVCDVYRRTDGGAASTLYVKESGSGNTGWSAVSPGGSVVDLEDLGDVVITTPMDTEVLTYDSGNWVNAAATGGGGSDRMISITIPDTSAGVKGYVYVPFGGTVISSVLFAVDAVACDIELDVWVDDSGSFPPTSLDSIVASDPPELTADALEINSTLTSWLTTIADGDFVGWEVQSGSDCSAGVTHQLRVQE
jgi:hypothetical protein